MAGGFPFSLLMLLPVLFWAVSLYLMLRFLRAIENGVRAHSRIADALERTAAAKPAQAFGDRAT
jgi:uncharacterized membrane protein